MPQNYFVKVTTPSGGLILPPHGVSRARARMLCREQNKKPGTAAEVIEGRD